MGWIVKPERKKLPGRPMCRWQDKIKMDLKETGHEEYKLDSFSSGQGQIAGSCNYSGYIKRGEFHFSSWNWLVEVYLFVYYLVNKTQIIQCRK
jgi:hypothetical protein